MHRFGVLQNKMLRKTFGHTNAKVRAIVCMLNAELCNTHCSSNISDQIIVGIFFYKLFIAACPITGNITCFTLLNS
jgi:hypothetical protein